ncbi:SH3 domain-containing protein [Kaistia algarum]|uniref:SH3 domain-containing protein n=1 Tax=Kaistia algarum TaxID=2083279 RepID=UPI0014034C43|nr:SH3 domain-containing protein [Kaistia algarum]MCX5513717.1 SH3 domain-containing protein [Kaistia algarum]
MKHSVQFAEREKSTEYFDAPRRAAETRQAAPTNPFARPERAERDGTAPAPNPAEPDETATASLDELVSELEAALMANLHSVSAMLEAEPPARNELEPPANEEETVDAEALQRLMDSIRQPAPKRPTEESHEEWILRPTSPLPTADGNADKRSRRATARPPERREPAGRRLQSSLIVGAALVALAGGGAFMTVQSVTAHDNTEPASTANVAAAASTLEPASEQVAAPAIEPEAAAPAPTVAKAEDRAPAETIAAPKEPAAPVRSSAANPEPIAASDASPRGDLGSLPEAATRSALGLPEVDAPAAAPAPERLASADVQTTVPGAAPEPVKRSLGTMGAGPAKITSSVKLRSNPDNGAPVIGVLSAGTDVTIVGCKGWCEVTAGDRRGFVFQRFLAPANAG